MSWNGIVVSGDVVPVASKKTASGATPLMRLVVSDMTIDPDNEVVVVLEVVVVVTADVVVVTPDAVVVVVVGVLPEVLLLPLPPQAVSSANITRLSGERNFVNRMCVFINAPPLLCHKRLCEGL
jgi:hypothetical protein